MKKKTKKEAAYHLIILLEMKNALKIYGYLAEKSYITHYPRIHGFSNGAMIFKLGFEKRSERDEIIEYLTGKSVSFVKLEDTPVGFEDVIKTMSYENFVKEIEKYGGSDEKENPVDV